MSRSLEWCPNVSIDITDTHLALLETEFGLNDYRVFGIVLQGKHPGTRSDVQANLAKVGEGPRPCFRPLHLRHLAKIFGCLLQTYSAVAEDLGTNGSYIPNGLGLSEFGSEYVIKQLRKMLA